MLILGACVSLGHGGWFFGGYLSPNGYHRHVTKDGRIIEHGDWNRGSAAAHRDVPRPWFTYNGPLPPSSSERLEKASRGSVQGRDVHFPVGSR